MRAFPAGYGIFGINVRGNNLYMNDGVSRYLVVQIVMENAENYFYEDNLYKEKGLPIRINVQIVPLSTRGRRKRGLSAKMAASLYSR